MGRPLHIGLYSPYFGSVFGGGERYLAHAAAALHEKYPEDRVTLAGAVVADAAEYRRRLGVDLAGIDLAGTAGQPRPFLSRLNRVAALRPLRDRALAVQADRLSARYDLFFGQVYRIPVRCRAPRGVMLCQFPHPGASASELAGYQLLTCQSEYVRGWIRRYWDRDAVVVEPPCRLPVSPPDLGGKANVVLSVGRFIRAGHTKRQDVLVEAFRGMCDAGLTGWELHLVGSVHEAAAHRGYFDEVARRATGYPITLHPDLGQAELDALYGRAAIYWHAAGYGADAEREPDRFEHFGMTTVEAMAHGAVPVVFELGGPAAIVGDGETGLHWRTPEGLAAATRSLIENEARRRELAERGAQASRRYSAEAFTGRWLAAVGPLVEEARNLAE